MEAPGLELKSCDSVPVSESLISYPGVQAVYVLSYGIAESRASKVHCPPCCVLVLTTPNSQSSVGRPAGIASGNVKAICCSGLKTGEQKKQGERCVADDLMCSGSLSPHTLKPHASMLDSLIKLQATVQ